MIDTKSYIKRLLHESLTAKQLNYVFKKDNDKTYSIDAYNDAQVVADISFVEMKNMYWFFKNDFTQDEYKQLFPENKMAMIGHVEILFSDFRGKGIAKELVKRAIYQCRKIGNKVIYLNAKPFKDGLDVNSLIELYKSLGFKLIKQINGDAHMILS